MFSGEQCNQLTYLLIKSFKKMFFWTVFLSFFFEDALNDSEVVILTWPV